MTMSLSHDDALTPLTAHQMLEMFGKVYEETSDHRSKMLMILHQHAAGSIGPKTAMRRLHQVIHDHDLRVSELEDMQKHIQMHIKESAQTALVEYLDDYDTKSKVIRHGLSAAAGAGAYHLILHGYHKPVLRLTGQGIKKLGQSLIDQVTDKV